MEYKDVDGVPKDGIQIFKDHGYTYARLRVLVDPSGTYGLFQDIDYVKEMARDIVLKHNMKLLIDFHYSHWWTSPRHQWIPLGWRAGKHGDNDVPLELLRNYVFEHTKAVMEELILQDTIPGSKTYPVHNNHVNFTLPPSNIAHLPYASFLSSQMLFRLATK